jgi:alanyl-tRNA synthetase
MLRDKELKAKLKPEFARRYKKYYPYKTLQKLGFKRYKCKRCKNNFWAKQKREFCDEPRCSDGYRFFGEKLAKKKLSYRDSWKVFVRSLGKFGYKEIKRYPVVARWYDQLYFVTASINDFQPYVVSGEVEPPANPLVVPQFCLRFDDVDNVGLNSRYYSGFIMPGQHVFNLPGKQIYWKEEALEHIYYFLIEGLGIPSREIFWHEDMWAGGGNFGPSMEYFCRGLELGNQVYIQFEVLPKGYRELKTKVIDHGGGLERYAWFTQALPISYEAVFPKVIHHLKRKTGVKLEKKILERFARYSGALDVASPTFEKDWKEVAKKVGVKSKELEKLIAKLRALYSIAEHCRALLVAIHDGCLPSNVAGGYNLRSLLRRCWSLIDEHGFEVDLKRIFRAHMREFGSWFKELKEKGSLFEIIEMEKERYERTKERGKGIVKRMIQRKEKFTPEKLLKLYDSHGIQPSLIKEICEEEGVRIKIPKDFYARVQALHEVALPEEKAKPEIEGIPKTKLLFYEKPRAKEFEAKVIAKPHPYHFVLNQTLFYPTAGGQLCDRGKLGGIPVINVEKVDGVVIHELEREELKVGKKVKGEIDWKRRKILTQHHTATHLINQAAKRLLGPHIWQHGTEKSPDRARLDITHYKSLSYEELKKIEKEANRIAKKNLKVETKFLPRREAERRYGMQIYQGGAIPGKVLRIVKIGNYDIQACGGTHCSSTREIGIIKIIGSERIQDGVSRIEFVAGKRSIEEIQKIEKILRELSKLWNVGYKDIPRTAKKFFEEWKEQRKELKFLREELTKFVLLHAISEEDYVKIKPPVEDLGMLMKVIQELGDRLVGKVVLFLGKNLGYAVSRKAGINAKEELEKFYEKVEGSNLEAKGFKPKKI